MSFIKTVMVGVSTAFGFALAGIWADHSRVETVMQNVKEKEESLKQSGCEDIMESMEKFIHEGMNVWTYQLIFTHVLKDMDVALNEYLVDLKKRLGETA